MTRLALLAVLAYPSCFCDDALAGWQGVEWGASEAAATAKFKIPVQPFQGKDPGGLSQEEVGSAHFTFYYKLNSYDFKGYMLFSNGVLAGIRLDSEESGACASARNLLTTLYGVPDMVASGTTSLPNWLDRKDSNRYRMINVEVINSCEVIIDRLPTGSGTL